MSLVHAGARVRALLLWMADESSDTSCSQAPPSTEVRVISPLWTVNAAHPRYKTVSEFPFKLCLSNA